ncbi:hypothetical protein ONE63_009671 [Megalurothrips usitatus]|uniref:Alpha-1,3-mannosyl-glycoprotein 4-beta-N-acetylglucosaminyltransferase B n=1 Tax=Megalurothrips usitatus TaxID=439358 RepID=A0AAV7XK26_9NEOP|nr:hypothetical protein ONE63_009671 [Megalurothrips usitatus]
MVGLAALGSLRRRHGLLGLVVVAAFMSCSMMLLVSGPDLSSEQALVRRVAELQARSQHLDALYRSRIADMRGLSQHLGNLVTSVNRSSSLSVEAQQLVRNLTAIRLNLDDPASQPLQLPNAYHFMPHLLDGGAADGAGPLRPAFCMCGARRSGVSMVLGVPTVRREVQSYLLATLDNLVSSMTPEESNDTLIVVFVAETDLDYVKQVAAQIRDQFESEVLSGLIELISPPVSYYPNLDSLRLTLGDSMERVRWRTKQNLDFAFLMMYAQPRATFYVQLEDDILAKKNFISLMKNFALEKTAMKEPWFVLEFCQLGFIGKLFKCVELPWLVQFFLMFYNDKPVDWLLDHVIFTKVCSPEKDHKHCKKAKSELWIQYKPSLFQHIGTHSSLKGKVQKLKDKQFGKVSLFFPHRNPPATVESDIKPYKQYNLHKAYLGESFFWGLLPQPGDALTFRFASPIFIKRFLFRSGNAEHPSDRLYNTSVEVKLASFRHLEPGLGFNVTSDGFVVVGQFDSMGVSEGTVDFTLGPIAVMRLLIHSESDNWAILSEILIEADNGR